MMRTLWLVFPLGRTDKYAGIVDSTGRPAQKKVTPQLRTIDGCYVVYATGPEKAVEKVKELTNTTVESEYAVVSAGHYGLSLGSAQLPDSF